MGGKKNLVGSQEVRELRGQSVGVIISVGIERDNEPMAKIKEREQPGYLVYISNLPGVKLKSLFSLKTIPPLGLLSSTWNYHLEPETWVLL